MTQMPPPPNVQYSPQYPQPSPANGWSIASLICGILGCLIITPIIAIVTGIIGIATAKSPRGGRGMAIAGIILGVIWIGGGVALVGGFGYLVHHVSVLAQYAAKPVTMQYLNRLAAGDTAGADKIATGLTADQQKTLIEQIKPLGRCTNVDVTNPQYDNVNGVVHFAFTGTATFEHGTKSIDVATTMGNGGVTIDKFEMQ